MLSFSLRRSFATTVSRCLSVKQIQLSNGAPAVNVTHDAGSLVIPLVWLRDHCRSTLHYNHSTNQRKDKLLDIFEKAQLSVDRSDRQSIAIDGTTNTITLHWKDGHSSSFSVKDIIEFGRADDVSPSASKLHHLWNRNSIGKLPQVDRDFSYEEFVEKFCKYGFVSVNGVPPTAEATKELCSRVAPIHNTFYGDFWQFGNKEKQEHQEAVHEDTAYSDEEIGPHTDGTYFSCVPGIQVFHCLRPADKGGDTILVDGFYVAEKLRTEHPEYFSILSKTLIDHHYLEGTDSEEGALYSVARAHPVIKLDADGNIRQIRFNPYDRAPVRTLTQSEDDAVTTVEFYKAYQTFSRMCHDPANSLEISLQPGTTIFIDNYRVYHARTAFQGPREMCGCYLSREDFMAKARPYLPERLRRFY